MEFVELKKHLKQGRPFPCYYCYGDDEYVVSRAVALLRALASEPLAFNVSEREFSSGRELTDELMQLPLMGDYRVVIARGKTDGDAVAEYLKKPNPSAVLVISEYAAHDSWNHNQAPEAPVGATMVDCNRLPAPVVKAYVKNIAQKSNTVFPDSAIDILSLRCAGYMTRISSEAQKLSLLRAGGIVTDDDVTREVRADTEFVVFELADSILKRNTSRALSIVDGMKKNDDLTAAFTLLYNRFKRMFAAAVDPDGLAALGVKPYMATRLKQEAAAFSKVRLRAILDSLLNADHGYKTGVMSQYDALYAFVAQASNGG